MKNWQQYGLMLCSAALAVVAVFCTACRLPELHMQDAALAAAGFILPGGAKEAMEHGFASEETTASPAPASSSSALPPSSNAPSSSSPSSAASSAPAGALPTKTLDETVTGSIKEMSIGNSGIQYENMWVKNTNKNHTIDIPAVLSEQPAVKIKKDGSVQVLIYHTHTTEAYAGSSRTQDNSLNVVSVGEEITKKLEAAGIGVVHDTTCHDYPSYNGSYDRSGETIQRNLEKYPGIQVTLDIHRDAMGTQDGTRIKPTVLVDGKKAAQVMIISGCDDDGTLGFPNWEYNLRLATRLQKSMSDLYPNLARPLNFCPRKYNEHMTKGSLLVEFGTEVNTLEEAKYAGQLFGDALVEALNQLT